MVAAGPKSGSDCASADSTLKWSEAFNNIYPACEAPKKTQRRLPRDDMLLKKEFLQWSSSATQ